MDNNSDESPLYLFDKNFAAKMGLNTTHSRIREPNGRVPAYWPPRCFGEDFFSVLGSQRPDNQWLIIGPARSGSTFHKDPNATSAWNAVLRGSKYWIMFPGNPARLPPPGVYVSPDQSEVTFPLSIAEWLLNFHAPARRTPGCLEGICDEGEVLHVPSGWWHLVVNLRASIAITHNFVSRRHLGATLGFLKYKADQVSGFKRDVEDPYDTFVERMRQIHPEVLEAALAEVEGKRKRKWDEVVHGEKGDTGDREGAGNGFSFGFGDDGSDADVP